MVSSLPIPIFSVYYFDSILLTSVQTLGISGISLIFGVVLYLIIHQAREYGETTLILPNISVHASTQVKPVTDTQDPVVNLVEKSDEIEVILQVPRNNSAMILSGFSDTSQIIEDIIRTPPEDATEYRKMCEYCGNVKRIQASNRYTGHNWYFYEQTSPIFGKIQSVTRPPCKECREDIAESIIESDNSSITEEDVLIGKI